MEKSSDNNIILSVIIPTYNVENYIENCLNSVLNQTEKRLEIICVDDGSCDNTIAIINKIKNIDKRVILLEQAHKNAGAARNLGMSAARGNYIHFLDGDDWLDSLAAYERVLKILEISKADICSFCYKKYNNLTGITENINQYGLPEGIVKEVNLVNNYKLLCNNENVIPWNKIYNAQFLKNISAKFDEIVCANDRSFYFYTTIKAKSIMVYADYLINYRVGNSSSLAGGGRNKNFDCHLYTVKNILDMSEDCPVEVRCNLLNINLHDLYVWYSLIEYGRKLYYLKSTIELLKDVNSRSRLDKIDVAWDWQPWSQVLLNYSYYSKKCVPVALFADNNNFDYVCQSVKDIVSQVKGDNYCVFYIFYVDLDKENVRQIEKSEENYSVKCIYFNSDLNLNVCRANAIRYLSIYKKVIFMDAGVKVKGNVADIFNTDIGAFPVGAFKIPNCRSEDEKFNFYSAFLLVNTDLCLKNNFMAEFRNEIKNNNILSFAFNKCFDGNIAELGNCNIIEISEN